MKTALCLYIMVLIFEILYYSLFVRLTRKEGNFFKYIISFTMCTMIVFICNSNNVLAYLTFILSSLFFLKYLVRIKVSLFDMLMIFAMLLLKVTIETPTYMILYKFLDIYTIGIIYSLVKITTLILLRNKLNNVYKFLKIKWDNNNFYIRYIFTSIVFIYVIISSVFIVFYYM